jgi:protocatechuate 3,4-dioxygenase beta subunit
MELQAQSPSRQIKKLHRSHSDISLKDFAVELAQNGTPVEKRLVETWLTNKAGETRVKEAPKPAPAPAKLTLASKPTGKKRG